MKNQLCRGERVLLLYNEVSEEENDVSNNVSADYINESLRIGSYEDQNDSRRINERDD
jgi:hypothetical protein